MSRLGLRGPRKPAEKGGWLGGENLPGKFTAVYLLFGALWLGLMTWLVPHGKVYFIEDSITFLGTSAIVFVLIRTGVRTLRAKESDLRESEDRLARIIETNVGGIVVFDGNGTITFANNAAGEILGVGREALIGLRHDDPALDLAGVDGAPMRDGDRPLDKVRTTRLPAYDVEVSVRHRDGGRILLTLNAAPLLDAQKKIVGTVVSFSDITERKKVEDLKIRKLLLAVEQSPSAIVITDLEGNVEYANPRYVSMSGCTVKEALCGYIPHHCMIPEEKLEEMRASVLSGISWKGEFRCLRQGGEPYWESTSLTPVRTAEGETTNILWVREDITARKEAEEARRLAEEKLRVTEGRFRQIFEQNEEPLLLFRGGSAEVVDVNPAAARMYGHPRDTLVREGISLFVPESEREKFSRGIAGIREGAALGIERMNHLRSDGQRIVVSIRGNQVNTESGTVSLCSVRDITARIRMEEEAKHHQAQLIHANRMTALGTIVSGVAHEVNNPNNLIMFNAPLVLSAWEDARPILDGYHRESGDFLLAGLPYSEMRETVPTLVAGVSDASRRIKAIVASLKDFARQDRGKEHAPVDVNDVVRTAIAILNHEILRGTHRFAASYGENLPPVMGSARQLEQIVINLVNNALQSLPSNRHGIRVGTRADDGAGQVEIFVEDEGAGMSSEVLERIKEPFFSTRLDSGGLGLGVSICKSIAEEHGGTLEYESREGAGTRASVRLPAIGGTMGGAEMHPPKIFSGR